MLPKNLKFPLKYSHGEIVDADGKSLIRANRNSNETPLYPSERDDMLKHVVDLLNKENNG